jgi:hypothetical protein
MGDFVDEVAFGRFLSLRSAAASVIAVAVAVAVAVIEGIAAFASETRHNKAPAKRTRVVAFIELNAEYFVSAIFFVDGTHLFYLLLGCGLDITILQSN